MKRWEFITLIGFAAAALPFAASAQRKAMPVVDLLVPSVRWLEFPIDARLQEDLIHRGLRETGYVDGQNVAIEYHWADGHYDRLPAMAAELAARGVDVIITNGTPGALAAKAATSTIPIVFSSVGD